MAETSKIKEAYVRQMHYIMLIIVIWLLFYYYKYSI